MLSSPTRVPTSKTPAARSNPRHWAWRLCIAAAFALLLAACAGLPPREASRPTASLAPDREAPLSLITQAVLPPAPNDPRSGFQLLPYGPNSFAARMELARLAQHSLDVQYYLLAGDNTGRALMRALRDAAARGVRVRLLVDDLYTTGEDDLLLALASTPNVEVRLFNPFPAGRSSDFTRFVSSGFDFGRVNRRMHNKLFIADNIAAVAGGRNMADEYVMNAAGSNFVDMDVFAAGPVVRELSNAFDHYWNSDVVYPVQRIAASRLSVPALQQAFEESTARAHPAEPDLIRADGHIEDPDGVAPPATLPPEQVHMLNLPFDLARHALAPLVWARARVLFDPLTKTEGENEAENSIKGTVTEGVIRWFGTARKNIKMVSPYFVPSDAGVAALIGARRAGLGVELVTNSLASTDEAWVYVGYWAHLKPLLEAGVEVRELSPSLSVKRGKLGLFGHRSGALHMKNAIVDHREVFLGSMNLDQRSAKLNTELGLIIESPEMARQLEAFGDARSVYRLRLSADGSRIEWVIEGEDGRDIVYDSAPETSVWHRFWLRVIGPFIPEKQL
jgi:putative cardiolipin synthase